MPYKTLGDHAFIFAAPINYLGAILDYVAHIASISCANIFLAAVSWNLHESNALYLSLITSSLFINCVSGRRGFACSLSIIVNKGNGYEV